VFFLHDGFQQRARATLGLSKNRRTMAMKFLTSTKMEAYNG
jgi:hypothetical protein